GRGDALFEEDLAEKEVVLSDLRVVGALGEDLLLLLEEAEEVLVLHEALADHDDPEGALLAGLLEGRLLREAVLELLRRDHPLLERKLADQAVGCVRHPRPSP